MNHPRRLGRDWLRAIPAPPEAPTDRARSAAQLPRPFDAAPALLFVPTSDELRRLNGMAVHRMTRDETAAWHAADPSKRDEARRAIREAVREQGGGELHDWRGRLVERIA